jgi:hypothetical protein
MGADMMHAVVWTVQGQIRSAEAFEAVSAAILAETDRETLKYAAEFAGRSPLEELAAEVALVDPEADRLYREAIIAGYQEVLNEFEDSLRGRDVSTITVGPLVGYLTGGMTWGDDPTDAYTHWYRLFDEPDMEWGGNPYRYLMFDAIVGPAYALINAIPVPEGSVKVAQLAA